uniref:Major facilitator superfamily (MFS) profile domain-containing protein n=1 Tax=Leptobrachium leishanense TaxID=445787 RepID=A0A8C5LJY6_9ANUR
CMLKYKREDPTYTFIIPECVLITSHAGLFYIQAFINSTWRQRYGSSLERESVLLLWSFIVSVYSIGGLLGSLVVGYLSIRFGRKKTQLCNNLAALLGALLMAMSQTARSFEMIILGRLLYGINAGVSLNLHTMYIGECAPQKMRGMVTVSVSFFIAVGKLMGFLIGLRYELWPYLMSFSAIPALIQLATLPFFPDSPRYLLLDKSDKDGSLKAMQQLWGPGDHSTEIKEILKEKMTMEGQQIKGMKDLFVDHSVRWQLIMMGLICGGMQFIGINAVTYFLLHSIKQGEHYVWFPYASCMFVFIFTLSFGLGPVSCVLPTELFIQSFRPAAYTLIGTMNWVCLFVLALVFPFIEVTLGPFCFIFFLFYCFSMAVFTFLMLPETKNKSIVEIMESFNQLNVKEKHVPVYVTRL